jgi:hypothetical protein
LMNQAESGISSRLLTLTDSPRGSTANTWERGCGRRRPRRTTTRALRGCRRCGEAPIRSARGGKETERKSVSLQNGLRRGNRRDWAAQARDAERERRDDREARRPMRAGVSKVGHGQRLLGHRLTRSSKLQNPLVALMRSRSGGRFGDFALRQRGLGEAPEGLYVWDRPNLL